MNNFNNLYRSYWQLLYPATSSVNLDHVKVTVKIFHLHWCTSCQDWETHCISTTPQDTIQQFWCKAKMYINLFSEPAISQQILEVDAYIYRVGICSFLFRLTSLFLNSPPNLGQQQFQTLLSAMLAETSRSTQTKTGAENSRKVSV